MLGARPESPNKDEAQVWRFGFGALPIGRHRFARLVARALPFTSTDLLPCVDPKCERSACISSRVYVEEKLSLRRKRRRKRGTMRQPLPAPVAANQGWSVDFMTGAWQESAIGSSC